MDLPKHQVNFWGGPESFGVEGILKQTTGIVVGLLLSVRRAIVGVTFYLYFTEKRHCGKFGNISIVSQRRHCTVFVKITIIINKNMLPHTRCLSSPLYDHAPTFSLMSHEKASLKIVHHYQTGKPNTSIGTPVTLYEVLPSNHQ